jgi:hypothetical protein
VVPAEDINAEREENVLGMCSRPTNDRWVPGDPAATSLGTGFEDDF